MLSEGHCKKWFSPKPTISGLIQIYNTQYCSILAPFLLPSDLLLTVDMIWAVTCAVYCVLGSGRVDQLEIQCSFLPNQILLITNHNKFHAATAADIVLSEQSGPHEIELKCRIHSALTGPFSKNWVIGCGDVQMYTDVTIVEPQCPPVRSPGPGPVQRPHARTETSPQWPAAAPSWRHMTHHITSHVTQRDITCTVMVGN